MNTIIVAFKIATVLIISLILSYFTDLPPLQARPVITLLWLGTFAMTGAPYLNQIQYRTDFQAPLFPVPKSVWYAIGIVFWCLSLFFYLSAVSVS